MRLTRWIVFALFAIVGNVALAAHNPLLPRPQQVSYSSGSISLAGMKIAFSSAPSAADRFGATELSRYMEERTGVHLPIEDPKNDDASGPIILLDRVGRTDEPLALPGDKPGPASNEAYDLSVTARGVKIHARSSAGIFYGIQTLRQLVEGTGAAAVLPLVEIHDWPSLAFRGTMVDTSSGPLPTEKEFERQLDFLVRWKANQYYLYSEDSIELKGYPLLDRHGRLTQDEVRRIVAYGRQRHIDVIPNLDLYAHEHDVFQIEKYSDLSVEPHGTEFDPTNPEVLPLLTDWINQFAQLFPSPFVNIGFDETDQIPEAQTAAAAKALFLKQLDEVTGLFQKHGKTVMAYDDIMVKYPQMIPDLPKGLIAVVWGGGQYLKERLRPLVAHHVPHFVQPGITSYNSITPDYKFSFTNIDTALAAGRQSGALGLVDAVWADDGQILFRMSYPGFAYGAAAPWQSTPMDKTKFFSDYSILMYPSNIAPYIASALENMSESETALGKIFLYPSRTMYSLWDDPFLPRYRSRLPAHRQDLREARLKAEVAETDLIHAKDLGADPATVNSLLIGSQLLDYAGEKFQTPLLLDALWAKLGSRRPGPQRWWDGWESEAIAYHGYLMDLMDRITDLRPYYRAEWLREYEPHRLGTALGRWDAEYQYWRTLQDKFQNFDDSSHTGDVLPPLYKIVESRNGILTNTTQIKPDKASKK